MTLKGSSAYVGQLAVFMKDLTLYSSGFCY